MTPASRVQYRVCVLVEWIFAAFVILACCLSIMETMSGPRRNVKNSVNSNALLMNKLSFRYSQNQHLGTREIADREFEKPASLVVDSESDPFRQWFGERKTDKYIADKKHPFLNEPIINNKNTCKNISVHFLIYFHSYWGNFEKRQNIRNTWTRSNIFKDITIRRLFILAKPKTKENQQKIEMENARNLDILQGDFGDSFYNLTRKSILAVDWINNYCIHARYVIKADDDMFVNMPALVEYLVSQIYDKRKVIMCNLKEDNTSIIVRDPPTHKWYVPKSVFPGRTHFPKFCNGYVVLMSTDLIPELYRESFSAPYFSVDDAYLFASLLRKVRDVHYEDISSALTLNQKEGLKEYQGNGPLTRVGIAAWETGSMETLWNLTLSHLTPWMKLHV